VLYSQGASGPGPSRKAFRYVPQAPEKILDAPELVNDYYLNLLDWSSQNVVAVALGPYGVPVGRGLGVHRGAAKARGGGGQRGACDLHLLGCRRQAPGGRAQHDHRTDLGHRQAAPRYAYSALQCWSSAVFIGPRPHSEVAFC